METDQKNSDTPPVGANDLDLDQLDTVAGGRKPLPTGGPKKPGDPCAGGE